MIKKEKVWKNAITNRKTKEMLCDTALSVLLNMHFMTIADMPRVKVEFAYLMTDQDGTIGAMFKVNIGQRLALLHPKTYYFGANNGNLHLLDSTVTEEVFQKVKQDMTVMHTMEEGGLQEEHVRQALQKLENQRCSFQKCVSHSTHTPVFWTDSLLQTNS